MYVCKHVTVTTNIPKEHQKLLFPSPPLMECLAPQTMELCPLLLRYSTMFAIGEVSLLTEETFSAVLGK